MAERKWTVAQQQAICHQDGSLLVSAAAGSGKTAVLVERAVRMITREEAPIAADRFLIVTFTNAAAEELRSRIGAKLEDEVRRRPQDVRLRKQRMLLRRAFIGTIDAFCQQLVKENFAVLSISPDVGIGDAAELAQLSQISMQETMEEMYKTPIFANFSSLYGRARSDRETEAAVLSLYEFTRTLANPEQQLLRYINMYEDDSPLVEAAWGGELLRYARQALEAAQRLAQEAYRAAESDARLAAYSEAFGRDLEVIDKLKNAIMAKKWDKSYELVQNHVFSPLKSVRTCGVQEREYFKNVRGMIRDIWEEIKIYCFSCTEEQYLQDRSRILPLVRALVQAVQLYAEKYMTAKTKEKMLDFSDFEHLALSLLQDDKAQRTPQAEAVSSRFDVVMVDEYQDTNELQNALYENLANATGSNLFYVGDVKQSIYRFRKADPGIFLAKKSGWIPYCADGTPSVLTLGHNFRSGHKVIDGVNYVFRALMSQTLGEVEYDAAEELICGSENAPKGSFELRLLEDPMGIGDAPYIAQRIVEMVQKGVLIQDGAIQRPCGYGDFCILLRARTHMAAYLEALSAKGIPTVCDVAEEVVTTPEVLPLVATLAAIDNPGDDVNLAAAMMGPLFGFSPDEMTRLRAAIPKGSLWGAVAGSEEEKAKAFVKTMSVYRALATAMPAGRLCEELVERTGYLSATTAMQEGVARRENLLRFIGWANEASATGRGGLAGFVRLLAAGRGPDAAAVKSVPGHVSVLTIHKSKGLEFPVCFLADATLAFNTRDLAARVQMHTELGVGLALREKNILYATAPALAIRRRREAEAMSEEMRVLYVALTRAKERVIVTLANKDPAAYVASRRAALVDGVPETFLLSRARSMGAWLVSAALCQPEVAGVEDIALLQEVTMHSPVLVGVEKAPAAIIRETGRFKLSAKPEPALVTRLCDGFLKRTARAALSTVPAKMSVSALAKKGRPFSLRRPAFMYKSGLTATEKGVVQHSFMQYADYEKAKQSVETEIGRLVQEGFITEEEAAGVNREGIEVFFNSLLAARIQQAEKVLREYDFITAIPAEEVDPDLPVELRKEAVLVQGIADAILVQDGEVEIVDYKTDHGKTAAQLAETYQEQLHLYRRAIEKALGLPVKKLTLWSFDLAAEIDVPIL